MLLFWILAGLISGGAALLMLAKAAWAERASGPEDPELEVYRRQLSEIDELAERGLLGPEEHRAAHAEAGRRLLGHARNKAAPSPILTGSGRLWVAAAAVAAPVLALGAYVAVGSPGLPDQPFRERLAQWIDTSKSDPGRLTLPQMRAVLEMVAGQRPNDPQPLVFLARVEASQGDLPSAVRNLQRAADMAPDNAQTWAMLGAALIDQTSGDIGPDARAAFQRARTLDPAAFEPRYMLARAQIAEGKSAEGLAEWRALAAGLPADDPRSAPLASQIAEVRQTGRLPAAPAEDQASGAPAGGADQAAFIQSMVNRLAARLKAQPDDPQGWARLIRAYGVLGKTAERDAAIAQAQKLFKNRPDALKAAMQTGVSPPP